MADALPTFIITIIITILGYKITCNLIPIISKSLLEKGLNGRDMLKSDFTKEGKGKVLPEATGLIAAGVYILLLSLFAPLPYLNHLLSSTPSPSPSPPSLLNLSFPHHSLATYLASLLSLMIAIFLGFLDDLFDIRWRFKVPIPIIASIPLLITYAAGNGITDIVLPKMFWLRWLFGVDGKAGVLHLVLIIGVGLGGFYYVYMALLSTFCTNSINILAGVNGVEVGQALVIAISIAVNDLLYLSFNISPIISFFSTEFAKRDFIISFGFNHSSILLSDRHLFSFYLILPLIGVSLALLKFNWFPAKIFIGDTFCYFAGMLFSVVAINGHFTKTLLLFFLPQIFNFIYSFIQLVGIVPCPRHRLPHFNKLTGNLSPSFTTFTKSPKGLLKLLLYSLSSLKLISLQFEPKTNQLIRCSNFTILNLILVIKGNLTEEELTIFMMKIQIICSIIGFIIRYGLTSLFYDLTRL